MTLFLKLPFLTYLESWEPHPAWIMVVDSGVDTTLDRFSRLGQRDALASVFPSLCGGRRVGLW